MENLLFWGRDKMNKVTNEKLLISLRWNSWVAFAAGSRPSSFCMLMCSCSCVEATELCLTQAVKWNVTLICCCSHSRLHSLNLFMLIDPRRRLTYACCHLFNFPNWYPCVFLLHPEASVEATHIISAISEIPSVPAPCDTEATLKGTQTSLGLVSIWCSVSHHDILEASDVKRSQSMKSSKRAKITQISVFKCIFAHVY